MKNDSNDRTSPMANPIQLSSVYQCESPDQAETLLEQGGDFVYQRDAHPNAEWLANECKKLHGTDWCMITSSGMAAIAAVALSSLEHGGHALLSDRLYGRTVQLFQKEAAKFGISCDSFNVCDLQTLDEKLATSSHNSLIVAETISNPMLRVADISAIVARKKNAGAKLMIDNTFATPRLCKPAELGADFVVESMSKIMNGHSDVMLGAVLGNGDGAKVRDIVSVWGLASSPFDCWLAHRGMATFGLRVDRACANALAVATFLESNPRATNVSYPGLESHPDHELSSRQFPDRCGYVVTFDLAVDGSDRTAGRSAVEAFIEASAIPFSPSLGETTTTLSHPESTSHRRISAEEASRLGIKSTTIRLSCGIEEETKVIAALEAGLSAAKS